MSFLYSCGKQCSLLLLGQHLQWEFYSNSQSDPWHCEFELFQLAFRLVCLPQHSPPHYEISLNLDSSSFQFQACDSHRQVSGRTSLTYNFRVSQQAPVVPACECYRLTVYCLISAAYQLLGLISSIKFGFSTAGSNQTLPQLLVCFGGVQEQSLK